MQSLSAKVIFLKTEENKFVGENSSCQGYGEFTFGLRLGKGCRPCSRFFKTINFLGLLTTIDGVDRETNGDWLNITVFGTDGGGLLSSVVLHIKIEDINDQAPVFKQVRISSILGTYKFC